jgi:hypothetical protein
MMDWVVSRGAAKAAEESVMRDLDDITGAIIDARQHAKQLLTYLKLTNTQGWSADQLRRSDAPGGPASDRQWLSALRGFAAPREPGRCGERE